jgi:hypothetical protein
MGLDSGRSKLHIRCARMIAWHRDSLKTDETPRGLAAVRRPVRPGSELRQLVRRAGSRRLVLSKCPGGQPKLRNVYAMGDEKVPRLRLVASRYRHARFQSSPDVPI